MKRVIALVTLMWFLTLPAIASRHAAISLDLLNPVKSRNEQMRSYMIALRQRIQQGWNLPKPMPYKAKIYFEVTDRGQLGMSEVQDKSDSSMFDESALAAIQASAPFTVPPQPGLLRIVASFDGKDWQAAATSLPEDAPPATANAPPLVGYVEKQGMSSEQRQQPAPASDPNIVSPATGLASAIRHMPEEERRRFVPVQPLQAQAEFDNRGTPRIPQWKLDAGYDTVLGKFYIGIGFIPIIPVNGPFSRVVTLLPKYVKLWQGAHPFPCKIRLTHLADGSGGYYFSCLQTARGPRGWVMPLPKTSGIRQWAIYYLQR